MQTFLPFRSYAKSAATLDNKRLGKQIIEAGQILRTLTPRWSFGWGNHPAAKQWEGHNGSLLVYTYAMAREWHKRYGRVHGSWKRTRMEQPELWAVIRKKYPEPPPWLGDPRYHISHQSNLLRKDWDYYAKHFPGVVANPELHDLEYFWPTREGY